MSVDVERMRFHAAHGCHEDERHHLLAEAADELVAHRALVAELREMPAEWAGAALLLLDRHGFGGQR